MKKIMITENFERLYIVLALLFIILRCFGVFSIGWGWTLLIAGSMYIIGAVLFLIIYIILSWQHRQDIKQQRK